MARVITYREALLEAQEMILRERPGAFVMGEGIDDPQAIFGSTRGLADRFGRERVMDMPLAEASATGIALGAATVGARPILVHQRMDFLAVAMDQMINHVSRWRFLFNGRVCASMIVRCIIGKGWGQGAQHSQALHAMFAHSPGLKIYMPFTPADAKGLLLAAADDCNPVLFVEHRALYDTSGPIPDGWEAAAPGTVGVLREGTDVTIAALSLMCGEALKAAEALAREGVSAEILDIRTLMPLDMDGIVQSAEKTGRLVIADVGWKSFGASAEIAAAAAERLHGRLKSPVARIGLPHEPTPSSPVLEAAYYRTEKHICEAVYALMGMSSGGADSASCSPETTGFDEWTRMKQD